MDILFTGPLPYERIEDTDAVSCLSDGWMTIGLIAAAPNTLLFRDILAKARVTYTPGAYQSTGAEAVYALGGFHLDWGNVPNVGQICVDSFRSDYKELEIDALPDETVYPWGYEHVAEIFELLNTIPERCCGIHWFGGNSIAQGWNAKLTHENYFTYTNTFTRYAGKVLDDVSKRADPA